MDVVGKISRRGIAGDRRLITRWLTNRLPVRKVLKGLARKGRLKLIKCIAHVLLFLTKPVVSVSLSCCKELSEVSGQGEQTVLEYMFGSPNGGEVKKCL